MSGKIISLKLELNKGEMSEMFQKEKRRKLSPLVQHNDQRKGPKDSE